MRAAALHGAAVALKRAVAARAHESAHLYHEFYFSCNLYAIMLHNTHFITRV